MMIVHLSWTESVLSISITIYGPPKTAFIVELTKHLILHFTGEMGNVKIMLLLSGIIRIELHIPTLLRYLK